MFLLFFLMLILIEVSKLNFFIRLRWYLTLYGRIFSGHILTYITIDNLNTIYINLNTFL